VAVSSVLLFAKFVTHRTRLKHTRRAAGWHTVCVVCSAGAVIVALAGVAVGDQTPLSWSLACVSAFAMVAAMVILLCDALVDDRKRVPNSPEPSETTKQSSASTSR